MLGNFPTSLCIAVCFHYVERRLSYLDQISAHFSSLGGNVSVTIVTNATDPSEHAKIRQVLDNKGFEYALFIPYGLGHPFLLTWSHLCVFREKIQDPAVSHFLYLEDDILVTARNMRYWIENRELLRTHGFIPSFLRVEKKVGDTRWYSSDCPQRYPLASLPRLKVNESLAFINLPKPYQGMYLLDRELMLPHLSGTTSNPDYSLAHWGIRERAAQGIIFSPVQKGFFTKNLIPIRPTTGEIYEHCFIHHTPNNYANQNPRISGLGSIPVRDLIVLQSPE